jgi:ABC-2 type transport system permease protein
MAAAVRLGWLSESNWTRWWLYLAYAAARPLSMCLILYFIYRIAAGAPGATSAAGGGFVAIYAGSAFFTMIATMTAALSWVIIEDREHYQILRYVYIAPLSFWEYIVGRSLPILGIAFSTLVVILAFGGLVLGLPLSPARIDWALMVPTFVLGLAITAALGMLFAGVVLITARHSMLLAEGVGSTFLLVCGVIYPIDFLPHWLRPVALALPMTYWMELVRRAYGVTGFSKVLAAWGTPSLMLVFLAATAALAVLAVWSFRRLEHRAKRLGKLDQATNY